MSGHALSGRHVVITRPPGQADKLQALIAAEGGEAVLFPLIAIAPLQDYSRFDAVIAELPHYDWIFFISSNAVQYGMPLLRKRGALPPDLKFAAIGPVTAAELANFGVTGVLMPHDRFDSEALLALPEMQDMAGKRCMIVRGVGGRELLAQTLAQRGATVTFAECYQRLNPQTDAGFLQSLWQNRALDALVVTSSEAMRHLLALAAADLQKPPASSWLRNTALCVNHARIAEEAARSGLHAHVADAPGDAAMLQCLKRALNQST
ncbi:MAG: uroporphyrinogen-III synthase [Methylophilaceae bacterium]|jgi:uroporphyrinogen-III synthase|nr:uroporphyrinogen-III synthase [Methylophilaceae bacterium]